MKSVFEMFGHSPFAPLMKHMDKVQECVKLVPQMMTHYLQEEWDDAKIIFKEICKTEHEADEIKKELRQNLPKSFMLPVSRADLLNYLKQQDNIADAAEDCGALCNLKHIVLPQDLHLLLIELIRKNLEAVEAAAEITSTIKSLTESGFSSKVAETVLEKVEIVSHLEWECDKAQMSFAKRLFEHEKDIDTINVILWFNILRTISKMSNAAEGVGVQMSVMLARG
ncbi:MAG: TIGR00153 family protein [Acidobacteria bacterium]|nr:TIGR00153 family protein [Acidobacteriota bacterium]